MLELENATAHEAQVNIRVSEGRIYRGGDLAYPTNCIAVAWATLKDGLNEVQVGIFDAQGRVLLRDRGCKFVWKEIGVDVANDDPWPSGEVLAQRKAI